ncbi:MAG: Uma2 family endonuclease [Gammaproteobacteria bacterium]|nr:MAG: Uma2 family endonuclease [Gammaproteobacteria bacterium]
MVAPELLPHYTLEDYRLFQGDWELIEGIPYAMVPSPTAIHQRTALKIARQLDEGLEDCHACQVLVETDWIVGEDTVVRPDVMVVCGEIEGEWPTQTPALIFEIVSPSSALKDERLKFELYQREGVGYYVLVYPERRIAKVFRWHEGHLNKIRDAREETHVFEVDGCAVPLDFARIWP